MKLPKIALLLLLANSACYRTIQVQTIPLEKPRLDLKNPETLRMKPVEFMIVLPNSCSEELEKLKQESFVCVSFDGYKNISENLNSIKVYLYELHTIHQTYRDYYEPRE